MFFFLQNLHHSEDLRLIDFDANQIKCFENIFGLALIVPNKMRKKQKNMILLINTVQK
jgi:hypothetical protein